MSGHFLAVVFRCYLHATNSPVDLPDDARRGCRENMQSLTHAQVLSLVRKFFIDLPNKLNLNIIAMPNNLLSLYIIIIFTLVLNLEFEIVNRLSLITN